MPGPTDLLMYTTVRIQSIFSHGASSFGTGFFFSVPYDDKKHFSVVVTNKHVIKDEDLGAATSAEFLVHLAERRNDKLAPSGKSIPFVVESLSSQWFDHPNSAVDLCAMPFGPLEAVAKSDGYEIY